MGFLGGGGGGGVRGDDGCWGRDPFHGDDCLGVGPCVGSRCCRLSERGRFVFAVWGIGILIYPSGGRGCGGDGMVRRAGVWGFGRS